MNFLDRDIVEKEFDTKFDRKSFTWFVDEFNKLEANHVIKNVDLERSLKFLENFLQDNDVRKIIFFPGSSWLRKEFYGKKPVVFDSIDEALGFLRKEIFYGTDDYFATNENLDWFLTVCHEEDFHISGSKDFVDNFNEKYVR